MRAFRPPLLGLLAALLTAVPAAAGQGEDYRALAAALDAWRPERARPIYDDMRRRAPEDPLTLLAATRLHFETGDYAAAEASWDALRTTAGPLAAYSDLGDLVKRTRAATADMAPMRSKRFEVWTEPGPDRMLAPFVLETLESGLDALIADLGIEIPTSVLPLRVEIYPDVARFVEVSTLTRKEVETSGTVALCKFHRMMIVSPRRMARGYRWRDTLMHELVHFVLSRATDNRLPLWLHEGIAKFEERRWSTSEVGRLHPIQSSILAEARARNVWIPFRDMMPSLAKLDSGWKTALAFSEVTLLVSHIVEDGGMPALRKVIRAFGDSPAAGYAALGVADECHVGALPGEGVGDAVCRRAGLQVHSAERRRRRDGGRARADRRGARPQAFAARGPSARRRSLAGGDHRIHEGRGIARPPAGAARSAAGRGLHGRRALRRSRGRAA